MATSAAFGRGCLDKQGLWQRGKIHLGKHVRQSLLVRVTVFPTCYQVLGAGACETGAAGVPGGSEDVAVEIHVVHHAQKWKLRACLVCVRSLGVHANLASTYGPKAI